MSDPAEPPQQEQKWECPYCQFITSQPWDGSTHYDVCPFATNWWVVGEEDHPMCGLCRKRMQEGETYRYIPLYREPDPEEAEESLGKHQLFILSEVCGLCATFRLVT